MPHTHSTSFPIRYYECDAYGHVNNSNYLRFMTEAAFNASAAVGYDAEKYDQLGHIWLPREKEVEFIKPLKYGDTAKVTTWVEDFRRVRSRRAYEFRVAGSDEVVARGHTEWVYLNLQTQRPATIPKDMMAAFFPEGLPEKAAARRRFPTPPKEPEGKFVSQRKVAWGDIDPAQHVNNARYLNFLEDAGLEVGVKFGVPLKQLLQDGYAWVARRLHIEYRLQARLDDMLEITTYLSNMKRASCIRNYAIRDADTGELVCQAYIHWAFIEIESERPVRIPQYIIDSFAPNLSAEDI